MAFRDKYDFEFLKNEAESLVINELEKQLLSYNKQICLCNDCVLDMVAIALNNIKPLYRASLMGALYTATAMEQAVYAESIQNAVSSAIEKVSKNPSHGPSDN